MANNTTSKSAKKSKKPVSKKVISQKKSLKKATKIVSKSSTAKTLKPKTSINANEVIATKATPLSRVVKKRRSLKTLFSKRTLSSLLIISGVAILGFSAWNWYDKVYSSPTNVFWAMFDNNLHTRGVTRSISGGEPGNTFDQVSTFTFDAQPNVQSKTTISQSGDVIKAETAGYLDANYARYTEYKPADIEGRTKVPDLTPILGKWASVGESSGTDSSAATRKDQYYTDALLSSSLMPFGNLTQKQRTSMQKFTKDTFAIDPNVGYVQKVEVNGKSAYKYLVLVKGDKQALLMKQLAENSGIVGFEQLQSNEQSTTVEMVVDKRSHHLLSIKSAGGAYTQNFSNYGVSEPLERPKVSLTLQELQDIISKSAQ